MAVVVGAVFSSFREFQELFEEYQRQNHVLFVKESARRIKAPSAETNSLIYESVVYGCKQGKVRRPPQITDGSRPNQSTIKIGCEAKLRIIMSKVEGRLCLKITQCNLHHNHKIGPEIAATYPENRRNEVDSTVRNSMELPSPSNNLGMLPKKQDSECEIEIKTDIDGDMDSWADQVSVDSAPYPSSSYDMINPQTSTSPPKIENLPFSNVAKKRKLEDIDETVQPSKENIPNLLQEDEHDTFGKTVAFKLRTLPTEQRLHAEKLVSEVLYEASFGSLSRNTRLTGLINTNNECTNCSSSSSQRYCDTDISTVDSQT